MPLLSIWNSNREAVLKMTVEQVVNNAGDGHLRDGNEASQELRGYLRICPSESLFNYARHCLENTFDKSGIVLQLLQPFEYTKIDRIIDVIFTTATDVEEQIVEHPPLEDTDKARDSYKQERTDPDLLSAKRLEAVEAFARLKGKELVRHSRTLFWSSDKSLRVCCAVSKRYEADYQPYWYAFHPNWDHFLTEANDSYFVLSCMDRDEAYAVPLRF
jgi:hypothetical protein